MIVLTPPTNEHGNVVAIEVAIDLMEPPTRLILAFVLVAVTFSLPPSQGLKIDVRNFGIK